MGLYGVIIWVLNFPEKYPPPIIKLPWSPKKYPVEYNGVIRDYKD
jgi:hypothetical protein